MKKGTEHVSRMSHTTKQLLLVCSIIVVLLIGFNALALMFIRSAGTSVSDAQNQVNALQAQVAEFSKYNPEDLQNLAQSIVDKFIARDGLVNFLEMIESQAEEKGVDIVIRSVDAEPFGGDAHTDIKTDKEVIRLKFETNGPWENTMKFVQYLEHMQYKVSVQGVSLSALVPGNNGTTPRWRGQVEMTVLKLR